MIYTALSNIKHNGVLYKKGDVVKGMTEKEAENLIKDEIIMEGEMSARELAKIKAEAPEPAPEAPVAPVAAPEVKKDDIDAGNVPVASNATPGATDAANDAANDSSADL